MVYILLGLLHIHFGSTQWKVLLAICLGSSICICYLPNYALQVLGFTSIKYGHYCLKLLSYFMAPQWQSFKGQAYGACFFFGFATMFVVTQLYGLRASKVTIITVTSLYVVMALVTYSGLVFDSKSFDMIHQVTWIPIILYGLVFAIVYVFQIPTYIKKNA